jgi:hypothetical protein
MRATLALSAGVHPKVVQERLGHAAAGITLNVYSHVAEGLPATPPPVSPGFAGRPIFGTSVSTASATRVAATMKSGLTCTFTVSEGGLEPPPPCGD